MKIEVRWADGVARITLRHPPLNILTRAMLEELRETLGELESSPVLRVLLIDAEGRHFSAGADVSEHVPPLHRELIPGFLATIRGLLQFPAPVVAAVRGRCLGGGFELVQAADMVVAAEGASFGQPEIALGLLAPAACALLPTLVTPTLAAELLLTGEPIDARRALAIGLVAKVVPDDDLERAAMDLAGRMARHSAAALRLTKRAMRAGIDRTRVEALHSAGALYLDDLMATHDALEGLQAFIERRPPAWTHQ
jgi:cyclohexa-1,5-dienecarbonyl-CoA hydratase